MWPALLKLDTKDSPATNLYLLFNLKLFSIGLRLSLSTSLGLLRVESCDFSQAEIEKTAFKAEQIRKMTTIFNQKSTRTILTGNICHFVNFLRSASSSFFLSLRKITWINLKQPKTSRHVEHLNSECLRPIQNDFKLKRRYRFVAGKSLVSNFNKSDHTNVPDLFQNLASAT